MPTAPAIHLTDDIDLGALNLKVESVNVVKPRAVQGAQKKNGSSLKVTFSYIHEGKPYKSDNLRVRVDKGRMKRIATGQQGTDLSSFTIIQADSGKYRFLEHLHGLIVTYLIANAHRIQPNVYLGAVKSFDSDAEDGGKFRGKSPTEQVQVAQSIVGAYAESRKAEFDKFLGKMVRDSFRLTRKEDGDWCLLKPSSMSDDYTMGLTVYRPRGSDMLNKNVAPTYDLKVYEIDPSTNRPEMVMDAGVIESLVGGFETKGMVDYEYLVMELKSPHMNSSERNISFGWIMRYVAVSSTEDEEFDPITNQFVPKSLVRKQDVREPDDAEPAPKKVKVDDPTPVPPEHEDPVPEGLSQPAPVPAPASADDFDDDAFD